MGAEFKEAQKLYLTGHYEDCIKLAQEGTRERPRDEDWPILLSNALLTIGQSKEAHLVSSNALDRMPWSIRLRVSSYDVCRQAGYEARAKELLQELEQRLNTRMGAYRDSASIVALGQAALLLGADARRVLDNFFNRVKKNDPGHRGAYVAIGQLALEKGDYDLAAKNYQEALEKFEDDPELLFGLAKAYSNGDRTQMLPLVEKVLSLNERHIPSLLLLADHLIDAEEDKKADEMLDRALAVNPHEPSAWAYRAVLAHLRNNPAEERKDRDTALAVWRTNPEVDYIIGQKLSQKYRFKEGSAYQRQALRADPDYLRAKSQLAQDLMRLGQEDEGWNLAEEVYKQDGYDVLAYNLVTLHDTLAKFRVLTNGDFKVRMDPREATIYGDRVTDLLARARQTLTRKYGLNLTNRTVVEIFPEQKDFAVRTFGMPGGEGFLGVCFGDVITANSPASHAASRINWESVLWHEFCHVVTLGLTKNKMPRWLSEGISVYEEKQSNPAWGQSMSPRYREMIMRGELTPVGSLSSAFLAPKTPFHLQFAYYESSLVVEFLIDHFGLDALKKLLRDLGEGKSINDAIAANTAPLANIEKDFAAFAKQRAEQLAPGLDFAEPTPEELRRGEDSWMGRHPKSLWGLTRRAKKLLSEKNWTEAQQVAQSLVDLYPDNTGAESGYLLLAAAQRGLKQTSDERTTLTKFARLDADAVDVYLRLMELDSATKDWTGTAKNAQRFLAVNPLVPQPYRYLADAVEHQGQPEEAIRCYRTLLILDPPDPADVHFHLARLLDQKGDPSAKREVLQALEEAPRFLEAHRLLLRLSKAEPSPAGNGNQPLPSGVNPGSGRTPDTQSN